MSYHPSAYTVGFRDVIAAFLLCVMVAATGLAYSALRPERHTIAMTVAAAAFQHR